MEIERLIRKCMSYSVVSFDIFDTLLKRDVLFPTDVFAIVERLFDLRHSGCRSGFANKRIVAENKARAVSASPEVTLEEIYAYLDFSSDEKDELQRLELEVEVGVLRVNQPLKRVFDACLAAGKQIYIVSDMYLPKTFLIEVLSRSGYSGYRKLYVSSEYRMKKSSGDLFRELLKREGIHSRDVIHIGDSRYADLIGARRAGIQSVHIKRNIKNTVYFDRPTNESTLEKRCLFAFLNNRESEISDRAEKIGYEVLGPIIYGYCRWVHDLPESQNARIWFAARDMHLFVKAYQMLYSDEENFEYIYLSRKSLRPLYAAAVEDITKSGEAFARGKYSLSEVINYMGYSTDDAQIDAGTNIDDRIYDARKLGSYDVVRKALSSPTIAVREKDLAEICRQYLKEHGLFDNDIVFVDAGWHGTTQYFLNSIQKKYSRDHSIYGCYIGCSDGTDSKIGNENYDAFIFKEYDDVVFAKGEILLESMILAPYGTTVGYACNGDTFTPILSSLDCVPKQIDRIQCGAVKFVEDMMKGFLHKSLAFSADDIKCAFEKMVSEPEPDELTMLGEIEFENFYSNKVAAPQKLRHYLFHWKEFVRDLKYSPWRIGFLYRLFKVRLPYEKIYSLCRRMQGKFS